MYIRDGQPFDIRQRQVVGDTQYPADWFEDPDARDANGIEPLHPTEAPAITSSQRLELLGYIRDEENRWVAHWNVVDLTADELAAAAAALKAHAEAVWEQIKAERDGQRTEGGVLVGGRWYHTDTASRIKWLGLKDSARDMLFAGKLATDIIVVDGGPVAWKTMGGTFAPVSAQLALDVVEATKVLDKQLFVRAEQHHALAKASPDPAAYDFGTGWPASFDTQA